MSTKQLTHVAIVCGSSIILLCLILLTPAFQTTAIRDKKVMVSTPKSKLGTRTSGRLKAPAVSFQMGDFQNLDFYKTIIDNNLFRPLGWRPTRPREPYRLIGTIIPTDEKIGAQAILQTTRGNTTYIVTRGDTLDADTTVIDIQVKQVTLEKVGKQRTLNLNTSPWLK